MGDTKVTTVPFGDENIILDHYAGLAMQALVNSSRIVHACGGGGAGAPLENILSTDQVADTAFRIAESMLYARRDCVRRLNIQKRRKELELQEAMIADEDPRK